MTYHAYAAETAGAQLKPTTYDPDPLTAFDVEIKITHCGICHSDLHIIDGDWRTAFPAIAGHEIVGTVVQTGESVSALAPGQRVGVGWQSKSCMTCEWCIRGETNLCPNMEMTCRGRPGGFADHIRVDSRFAYPLPDNLDSENAAPLLCAGITVYAPLRHHGVNSNSRVGVVGIGGLGHLAIQFAAAFGAEVTAFTSSPAKADEARQFGATKVLNSRDRDELRTARRSLDLIVSTVAVPLDWNSYLKTLRPNGKLVVVGAVSEPLAIPAGLLIGGQLSVTGSSIGDRATMIEMLNFAARHGIVAQTEAVPMTEINAALDKVRDNAARYRMVLVNDAD
jgi:alcohol/geraniol dehydrogenase (NADP+)